MIWRVAGGRWRVKTGASLGRVLSGLVVAVVLAAAPSTTGFAQETPQPKDDSIDSLLEKLSDPSDNAGKKDSTATSRKETPDQKKAADSSKFKDTGSRSAAKGTSGLTTGKDGKPDAKKPEGSSSLSGKDQEVDELLQKLGETPETPSPDDRRGGGGPAGKPDASAPPNRPGPAERNRLTGKDKETDEHLEELTGRKRRKKDDNEERTGPAGQIIKEMRDIEQKLSKPDTGEATREEQKKVVKQIETLIEEARRTGQSSMRRMVMRQVRQAGQQGGKQQGSTDGAMAQGAPATKPSRPTSKHSNAGGKDIWGHLPPELRAEIENMINELPLSTKQELIDRYFLSVGKGKPLREEEP